jgi:flagellar export protein FliJ
MKKYVFRLETVRRVRKTQEDLAKSALLNANGEVQRAIKAVEERTTEYEAASQSSAAGAGVELFMKQRYFNELAGQALIAAQSSRKAAEVEAAAKRDLWSEAAKRVKALDRLDDRRRAEYLIDTQREEIREVDDMVTGRFRFADRRELNPKTGARRSG